MKTIAPTICLGLVLAGCASAPDGSLRAHVTDVVSPGARQEVKRSATKVQRAADDAKCKGLGFKPGTEGFGNCQLQLEQIRAIERAAAEAARAGVQARRRAVDTAAQPAADAAVQPVAVGSGRKVYDASECIGPVVIGECKGSILPNKAYHPTCHGEWLNGQCTGPMF